MVNTLTRMFGLIINFKIEKQFPSKAKTEKKIKVMSQSQAMNLNMKKQKKIV